MVNTIGSKPINLGSNPSGPAKKIMKFDKKRLTPPQGHQAVIALGCGKNAKVLGVGKVVGHGPDVKYMMVEYYGDTRKNKTQMVYNIDVLPYDVVLQRMHEYEWLEDAREDIRVLQSKG